MAGQTDYIGLNTYEQGDENWTHSEDMIVLDSRVIESGLLTNRPTTAPNLAWYYATDENTFYQYDAGGSQWNAKGGLGADGTPLPQTYVEQLSLNTAPSDSDEAVRLTDLDSKNIESFPTNGASGEVPVSQGDGTLAMESISGGGGNVEDLSTTGGSGTAPVSDGSGNLTMQDVAQLSDDVESFATSGADGEVPVSQGDGTLAMESVNTSGNVEDLSTTGGTGTAAISDGSGNLTMQDVIQPSEDVETLSTSGASGTAPLSDGAGNLTMQDVAQPSDNVEGFATAGASGTVPVSQGDGTLAMESISTSGNVEDLSTTAGLNEGFVGDGSGNVVLQSMEIELLEVATEGDLPDPTTVTQPTISYIESEDDYVATFDSTSKSLTNEQLDIRAQMHARRN